MSTCPSSIAGQKSGVKLFRPLWAHSCRFEAASENSPSDPNADTFQPGPDRVRSAPACSRHLERPGRNESLLETRMPGYFGAGGNRGINRRHRRDSANSSNTGPNCSCRRCSSYLARCKNKGATRTTTSTAPTGDSEVSALPSRKWTQPAYMG